MLQPKGKKGMAHTPEKRVNEFITHRDVNSKEIKKKKKKSVVIRNLVTFPCI